MTCRQPKRPHAITSNAAGSLQITKLWWLIPLVKNSCWDFTVQMRSLASAKVCYGRNEEGIYIIIRIRAAGMNQGVIWTSLISQPQKSHLFLWHNESYTPRLGEKAQLCQIWQSFWKEMLKPCIEKQRLWLIRIKEQCGNCRCMQQFRIDSLSVYEFEWNWPNLKGIMWIYITKYIN